MPEFKEVVLMEIATELLVNEIARRARMKNMTIDELWNAARENWDKAGQGANDLRKLGHETEDQK